MKKETKKLIAAGIVMALGEACQRRTAFRLLRNLHLKRLLELI